MCMPKKTRGGHRVLPSRSLLFSSETGFLTKPHQDWKAVSFSSRPVSVPPQSSALSSRFTDTHSHARLYLNTGDSNLGRPASAICVLIYWATFLAPQLVLQSYLFPSTVMIPCAHMACSLLGSESSQGMGLGVYWRQCYKTLISQINLPHA